MSETEGLSASSVVCVRTLLPTSNVGCSIIVCDFRYVTCATMRGMIRPTFCLGSASVHPICPLGQSCVCERSGTCSSERSVQATLSVCRYVAVARRPKPIATPLPAVKMVFSTADVASCPSTLRKASMPPNPRR